MSSSSEISERVAREKVAHDVDGVWERNLQLKGTFCHVTQSPSMARLNTFRQSVYEEVRGKHVLDYGCGKGLIAERLIEQGGTVDGIDISESMVRQANERMQTAGISQDKYKFQVMDAHKLEFPDNTFDMVIGNAILHHLDIPTATREINRVLKPGGKAAFLEPLGGNPLLKLFRALTPKARTPDERPFFESDLEALERDFILDARYFGLFTTPVAAFTSIVLRPFPNNPLVRIADMADRRLTRTRPMRSWHQFVYLIMIKRGGPTEAEGPNR